MPDATVAILVTLIAYKLLLLGIGVACARRTHSDADFLIGGRQLGPWVAALSASASSSSVWTLLGVSGYAYLHGLSALWMLPGCIGGFALNWCLLARRLRALAEREQAVTVTDVLAEGGHGAVRAVAAVITLLCLLTYVSAQIHGAGLSFEQTFGLPRVGSVLIGTGVVVAYTLLGGFWAVSITDTVQGTLMALAAVLLPVVGFAHVGSDGLARLLHDAGPAYRSLFEDLPAGAGAGVALGLLAIGLGYPGQPHVVNRLMALRSERELARARAVALTWAVLVYGGMVLTGLCARATVPDLADHEAAFFALSQELMPPVAAGVLLAAVLSAIMSTADSQLLVAAGAVTHDLRLGGHDERTRLRRSRAVVLALSVAATAAALLGSDTIFRKVLFAWVGLGASLGPPLVLRAFGRRTPPAATVAVMVTGFGLAVWAYYTPGTSQLVRNGMPIAAALALAAACSRRLPA